MPKHVGGMGFSNFSDFNDALLAKQCWRLVMDPNSLWAQVFKARYFPHCSFLEATRGGRALWGWSSLLVGGDILLQGAHWQILNGANVRVWRDRWIPSFPLRHPIFPGNVQVSRNLCVSFLICGSSRSWDLTFSNLLYLMMSAK